LALFGAGVEPLVLAGEVEVPVFVEVAVADHCAQGEDGFGAVQAPACSGDVEPVADQVAACSFDDPGGDGPARGQGLVVAQELLLAGQVADAGIRAVALAGGKDGGVGFGGDLGGGPGAVAGQYRERFDRYPVLGGRITGGVQGPCGLPQVLELSTVSAHESYVLAGHIVVAIDVTLTRR
jgi:hypothetical protein